MAMAGSLGVMSVQHPPELKHFVDNIILITIMYFTTFEHLKARIIIKVKNYSSQTHYNNGCSYELKEH